MKFAFNFSIIASFFVIVVAQLFEVYELSSNGNLRPVANTPSSTQRYSNNMFLNNQGGNRNDQVKYDGVMIVMEISDCSSFWTIQNDYNGAWGQLAIPPSDSTKAILRVVLSVAARLPSVS